MLLFSWKRFQFASDEDTRHSLLGVAEDLNAFHDTSGSVACSVVLDGDVASTTWRDGVFGVISSGTSATGLHLIDDEFGLPHIGELKDTRHLWIVGIEFTEIDGRLLEFQYRKFLGVGLDAKHEA